MGSDPEKLFPFSQLIRHWKKYSMYGMFFAMSSLELLICDKSMAPDLTDYDAFLSTVSNLNSDNFKTRFLAIVRHFSTWYHKE